MAITWGFAPGWYMSGLWPLVRAGAVGIGLSYRLGTNNEGIRPVAAANVIGASWGYQKNKASGMGGGPSVWLKGMFFLFVRGVTFCKDVYDGE